MFFHIYWTKKWRTPYNIDKINSPYTATKRSNRQPQKFSLFLPYEQCLKQFIGQAVSTLLLKENKKIQSHPLHATLCLTACNNWE